MNIQDIASVVGIISTSITVVILLGKWLVVLPLKNFIEEQTHPIQPHANGGRSLSDVAKTTIEIKTALDRLAHQVDKIEDRLNTHIEQHIKGEA
jgi:hypothetical protein